MTNTGVQAPPTLPATTPTKAMVRVPYSFQIPTTGSPAPAVRLVSGALPTGLAIAPDGTISGTPTATGTYSFSLQATNSAGSATSTTSLTVLAMPRVRVTGTSVAEGNTGTTQLAFHLTLSRA